MSMKILTNFLQHVPVLFEWRKAHTIEIHKNIRNRAVVQ